MHDLAEIQRRFYELVTAGEGAIDPGLLGGSRRLDVYAEMYVARLVDVLADDYPKLRSVLGAEPFQTLVAAYLRARPPRSFTIRDAGEALAAYLETRDDLPPWAADLARLERARVEVFDGPDREPSTREDLARIPIEEFPDLAIELVPSSELVPIGWTVDDLWSAIEDDTTIEAPTECNRTVLVWRRDLGVLHRTLDGDEAELVPFLARRATMAALSERLVELEVVGPETRLVELLGRWLDGAALVCS
ncbi:MAG: putative DNA-binding domain-containing protein [Deltaproteobacteria bacterium]|nr:putative DNA-binding domain-containing protein [Deltaproteobacteria bacterium]